MTIRSDCIHNCGEGLDSAWMGIFGMDGRIGLNRHQHGAGGQPWGCWAVGGHTMCKHGRRSHARKRKDRRTANDERRHWALLSERVSMSTIANLDQDSKHHSVTM